MFTKQQYTGSLSETAYYLESNRRAAVIVLLHDTGAFLQLTGKNGTAIRYISHTAFQAVVAGSDLKLPQAAGIPSAFCAGTETGFPIHQGKNASLFKLGNLTTEAGHAPALSCFLLQDKNGKPYLTFKGNTLFTGDEGHPDTGGYRDLHVLVNRHSNFHCNTKINKEGYYSLSIHYGKRINKPVRCGI